jgi:hypothetical protein
MERRASQRQRILKAGSIEFDGTGIDCTIRNISPLGATIEVASPAGIPHEISLLFRTQHVRQHGYIVWRKERRMGVRFLMLEADESSVT